MDVKKSVKPRKPHLLKLPVSKDNAFIVKGDAISWNNPWHFHPEIELLYCIRGKGTNYVGNYIQPIEEGELLLFGKNLPHTRQRDADYYCLHPEEQPETIVVQFRDDVFGETFFTLRECVHIKALIEKSARGMRFTGKTRDAVAQRLFALRSLSGVAGIVELISILDLLARSDEFTFLNAVNFSGDVSSVDTMKIARVHRYTEENFMRPIALADVADLVSLTEASFCRYFKSRTRKSYFQYLAEVRISHACTLLLRGDMDVSQVSYASGFNNLSSFHKQFKRLMSVTPGEYREAGNKRLPGGQP